MRYIRLTVLLLLAACGDAGTTPTTPSAQPTPVVALITMSPTSLSFASFGQTQQLTATVKDQNDATMSGASVAWATNASYVATVSSSGLVTSVGNGSARITTTSGTATATAAVTVAQLVATIELSHTLLTLTSLSNTSQLSATVKDENGNEISAVALGWSTSDTTVATVSSAGLVTAVGNGTATITAASGAISATAEITVTQGGLSVDPITVTWTEGGAATITGTGFSATPSSNSVTLDTQPTTITSASTTQLTVIVPTFACKPSRMTDLVVTVGNESTTATVGVKPNRTIWDLNVGGGVYTTSTDCINLDAGSGSEKYIVGVFSSSESPASLTAYIQTAFAGSTLEAEAAPDMLIASEDIVHFEAPIITVGDQPAATHAPPQKLLIDPEYEAARIGQAEAEARLWEEERRTRDRLASIETHPRVMPAAMEAAILGIPVRSVGDTIPIRVWDSGNLCRPSSWPGYNGTYTQISAVVRHIGTSAIYMEDIANPLTESFTAAEYGAWDATFSGTTLPTLTNYFGALVDEIPINGMASDTLGLDGEGRIGVIITKEVNKKETWNGFVNPYDLWATSSCPISNQAEVFYGVAPDPAGVHGKVRTKEQVSDLIPALIAHEVTHILQNTQRYYHGAARKARWEIEGGATLAEQLVGNAVLGHGGSGQNLGRTQFIEGYNDRWYKWAPGLRRYFGYSSSGRVEYAPEQCSWLGNEDDGNTGPCTVREVYDVPSMLLRFILDWYGPGYTGGEAALMRDLTSSAQTGYDNLVTTTGAERIGFIQTLFGLNLYSDGRAGVYQGSYTKALTSWDLTPIINLFASPWGRLQPYTSSSAEPVGGHSVRGGSTAYLEWEPPSPHAPTSLRIRAPSGGGLPDQIGMWIYRIQ